MLAVTQALGPKLLIPRLGAVGAVKLGLSVWTVAALVMAFAPSGGIFSAGCVTHLNRIDFQYRMPAWIKFAKQWLKSHSHLVFENPKHVQFGIRSSQTSTQVRCIERWVPVSTDSHGYRC